MAETTTAMICALCRRTGGEGEGESKGDYVRVAHIRSDGTFEKGYYRPTGLNGEELRVLKSMAPADVHLCSNREACRKRLRLQNEDRITYPAFTALVGMRIVAFRGYRKDKRQKESPKLAFILFGDGQTYLEFCEMDSYTYHDHDLSARTVSLRRHKRQWQEMFQESGCWVKVSDKVLSHSSPFEH